MFCFVVVLLIVTWMHTLPYIHIYAVLLFMVPAQLFNI